MSRCADFDFRSVIIFNIFCSGINKVEKYFILQVLLVVIRSNCKIVGFSPFPFPLAAANVARG